MCTVGAMIHKVVVRKNGRRRGTEGCTSAGTDARVEGTVEARVKHVIDRGGSGAQSARHLAPVLVSESKSNSRP